MEKISLEFFELIGAALPGIPIFIIGCFVVSGISFSFDDIMVGLKHLSIAEGSISLLICYCIGFCIHYPGYEAFKHLVEQWPKRTLGREISLGKRENELVTIRQKSPENFKILNKFFALRMMGYSMFFSLVIFMIYLLINCIVFGSFERDTTIALIVCGIFGFLFLRRAVDFHWRSQIIIDKTMQMISNYKNL